MYLRKPRLHVNPYGRLLRLVQFLYCRPWWKILKKCLSIYFQISIHAAQIPVKTMEYVKTYKGKSSVNANLLIREHSAQVSFSSQECVMPPTVYLA